MSNRDKYEGEDAVQLKLLEVAHDTTVGERNIRHQQQIKALIHGEPMEKESFPSIDTKTLH